MKAILTIGAFDGIHYGHVQLLQMMLTIANKQKLCPAVLFFSPTPKQFFSKEARSIMTIRDKYHYLKTLGVEKIDHLPFSHDLSKMTADQFMQTLKKYYLAEAICVGEDFCFGHQRLGTTKTLKNNFKTYTLAPYQYNGQKMGSGSIRHQLINLEFQEAYKQMPYSSITGLVTRGKGQARLLGCPTANIILDSSLYYDGSYAGYANWKNKRYPSVIYFSHREIDNIDVPLMEVHLLDEQVDLYSETLEVDIIDFIGKIQSLNNVTELKEKIQQDMNHAKAILNNQFNK